MTDQQLYLLLSPLLLAVFGIFFTAWRSDKRLDDFKAEIVRRFDGLETRIDKLDGRVNSRIDRLDGSVNARIDRLDGDIKGLREDYTRFYGEQRKQQEAIDILKSKMLDS